MILEQLLFDRGSSAIGTQRASAASSLASHFRQRSSPRSKWNAVVTMRPRALRPG